MAELSDRLKRLAPSATLAMSQKSSEMKAQGIDVINMSVGEPDFMTPGFIKEAGKKAIDDNYSKYSPVPGYPVLREAIARKLKRENGLDYAASEIIVGTGGKQGVCNAILALVNPGDEVVIPAPYWVSYPQMVKLAGGTPVIVPAGIGQDFKITAAQLEAAVTPKTKLVILCSPSNPTGSVYSEEELGELAKVVLAHDDLFVLSDEIYEHINYIGGHSSIAACPGMRERTVVCNGVSKAYAMTGWRLGYALGNPDFIAAMTKIHEYTMLGAPITAQIAAVEALRRGEKYMKKMVAEYDRRRRLIYDGFQKLGLSCFEPKGAFYIFPNITSSGYTDEEFAENLLIKEHVALVPGSAFGESGKGHIRCSYATSIDKISEALARIGNFLKNHRK